MQTKIESAKQFIPKNLIIFLSAFSINKETLIHQSSSWCTWSNNSHKQKGQSQASTLALNRPLYFPEYSALLGVWACVHLEANIFFGKFGSFA